MTALEAHDILRNILIGGRKTDEEYRRVNEATAVLLEYLEVERLFKLEAPHGR